MDLWKIKENLYLIYELFSFNIVSCLLKCVKISKYDLYMAMVAEKDGNFQPLFSNKKTSPKVGLFRRF